MANKQGVHPFNICLFVVVVFHSFIYFLKNVFCSIFVANIHDALFFKRGKTRTCFSVVSLVLFLLILLLL